MLLQLQVECVQRVALHSNGSSSPPVGDFLLSHVDRDDFQRLAIHRRGRWLHCRLLLVRLAKSLPC